jgi:tetratricopeptide (TPR) repeat protein
MYQDAVRAFRQGRVAEAVRFACEIGERQPDYQPAQLLLAEIAARQGRREAQRDHLVNALGAGRIDGPAAAHAVKLVGDTGDAAGIRRLLAILPQRTNEVGLLVQAALTALRLGATDEGVALLRSLAAKVDHPQIHYNLGTALKNAGDLAGAEAALRRAATLAPDLAEAHHNLGNLLLDQGRAGEAATH